jgi:hypothetical protein
MLETNNQCGVASLKRHQYQTNEPLKFKQSSQRSRCLLNLTEFFFSYAANLTVCTKCRMTGRTNVGILGDAYRVRRLVDGLARSWRLLTRRDARLA